MEVSMTAGVQFGSLIATVTLLVVLFPGIAACQKTQGTPEGSAATRFDYLKSHTFPEVLAPCRVPSVPEPRLKKGRCLQNLIVGGKLALTVDDGIALALENNLEIAVARYDLPIAPKVLLPAKGGGATRGVAGHPRPTGSGP
jgi:hypothetical protein